MPEGGSLFGPVDSAPCRASTAELTARCNSLHATVQAHDDAETSAEIRGLAAEEQNESVWAIDAVVMLWRERSGYNAVACRVRTGATMRQKGSILESITFLAMIGLLAGVLGGLAVGFVTGRTTSATSSAAK